MSKSQMMSVDQFKSATRGRLFRHNECVTCPECRKGALFQVEQPRVRDFLGQATYRCERCKKEVVVDFKNSAPS